MKATTQIAKQTKAAQAWTFSIAILICLLALGYILINDLNDFKNNLSKSLFHIVGLSETTNDYLIVQREGSSIVQILSDQSRIGYNLKVSINEKIIAHLVYDSKFNWPNYEILIEGESISGAPIKIQGQLLPFNRIAHHLFWVTILFLLIAAIYYPLLKAANRSVSHLNLQLRFLEDQMAKFFADIKQNKELNRIQKTDSVLEFQEFIAVIDVLNSSIDKINSFREKEVREASTAERNRLARKLIHDISSPISALKLVSQQVELGKVNEDLISILKNATNRVVKISDEFMGLARESQGDSPEVAGHSQPLDLKTIVEQIVKEKTLLNKGGSIVVSGESKTSVPDSTRMSRVLSNLIDNSFEAGAKEVIIEFSEKPCEVLLLKDNGSGMPIEIQKNAFHRPVKSTKMNGNGIGLLNCAEILNEMNLAINILSTSELGTTLLISKKEKG